MNKPELIQQILLLQRQIGQELHNQPPHSWLEINLSIAQLKSLFFIDFEGSTNFKKLAAALGVTPPNVTGIVDRLVEQGLVSREENPLNRRMQLIKLTSRGMDLISGLKEQGNSHFSGFLSLMELSDLSALSQGLSALVKAAGYYKENHQNEHYRS